MEKGWLTKLENGGETAERRYTRERRKKGAQLGSKAKGKKINNREGG